MAGVHDRLTASVLFLSPEGVPSNWSRTDTWRAASRIPGVTVMEDEGGREAALFGASTSGQVVVYDEEGRLMFSGGITPSRGHPGENAGRSRIVSLVSGRPVDRRISQVFGCALTDSK